MVSKQLNKIIVLIAFVINTGVFSQMKMADIEGQEFSVNSRTEKKSLIKILDNSNYTIYYIIDRRDFNLKKGLGTNGVANIIFFSKKYTKGILVNFEKIIYHVKTNIFKISLHTGSHDKYMFIPSMIILDKDFNYEYEMKYYYMPLPPPKSEIYASSITIQNIKNCNGIQTDIKGNIINENIDDILSYISKVSKERRLKECNHLVSDKDLNFFPKKILK